MKILLIGLGRWGKNHLRIFSGLGQKVFVADLDPKNLEQCKEFNIPEKRLTTRHQDFLGEIDAVSVVTPTDSHFKIALDCLKAGKDILIEKPMTKTSEEAKKLMKLSEREDRILQVGHVFKLYGAIAAIIISYTMGLIFIYFRLGKLLGENHA